MPEELFGAAFWESVNEEAAQLIDDALREMSEQYMKDGRMPNVKPPSATDLASMSLDERAEMIARMGEHPAFEAEAWEALARSLEQVEGVQ